MKAAVFVLCLCVIGRTQSASLDIAKSAITAKNATAFVAAAPIASPMVRALLLLHMSVFVWSV